MNAVTLLLRAIAADPGRAEGLLRELVATRTFPLVEEDIATFFFFDGQPVDEVYLIHWVFGLEGRQPFLRIPGTQAFYLPVELPRDARVEYKLEVHRHGETRWIHDPFNPRRAYDPFGSNSVCPMPGYAAPRWTQREPGTPRGILEDVRVDSAVWGGRRTLRLYRPAEYKDHKAYPLVICHDGDDYLRYAGIEAVLDTLIHRHEVRPLLVAFTSGGQTRNVEYGANPDQARFLAEEVLPAVRRVASVSEHPRDLALMGASFGAVSSLYTAWSAPGRFRRLLLQSGSFAFTDVGRHDRGPLWDPIVAFVNDLRRDPSRLDDVRIYVSCGTFESLILYNRGLVTVLRGAGIDLQFVESRDGHNWVGWRDRLREGLTFLFPGHLRMYYE